ncbi:Hypothetical protein PHPALM_989 [Phytophthora palmivora]|uniref:SGNH hydrolase-type esterase domain-containing protein n=1 Tax=Phytophthora palmivora TaxID=4796 RepID=A0A2P4YTG1_9STRA|nr:Hypothetical protein PHPALM_989 [Phytophthora palmivora]
MPIIENEISFQAYTTPSFITIWLGTNDAALVNGSDPETHVPIKNYKENLIQIVTAFQASAPNAGILLITPPHIDDGARAKYASEVNHTTTGVVDRSNAMTANYSLAALDAAKTLGVPVLDLNAHFNAMPELTRNALLIDGIHFNADGHKIVDKLIRSKVKSEFPSFDKALQSLQFPQASDLALEDPYM